MHIDVARDWATVQYQWLEAIRAQSVDREPDSSILRSEAYQSFRLGARVIRQHKGGGGQNGPGMAVMQYIGHMSWSAMARTWRRELDDGPEDHGS